MYSCLAMLLKLFFWLLLVVQCRVSETLETPGAPLTLQYRVLEEQPGGTKIGSVAEDLRRKEKGGSLEDFRVVEYGHALPFTVGEDDGVVTTNGRLDREELCRNSELCHILFNVLYRRDGAVDFIRVLVEIEDINDHSPAFPNAEQEVEVSETAALRTRIPLDRALDPDAGANSLQTYSLSHNEHFVLDVKSLLTGGKQAELVVIKELDREDQSSFELSLVAWDKGDPPKSGSTLIKVNILDSNDNNPVFEDSTPTVELGEDTPRGTVVINLKATDPDQGANGQIEYSLSKHAPLDVQNLFSVDSQTGMVTLMGLLDYEQKQSYEIDIQAKDLGPNAIPSHCKLHVKVKDINDNAPRIHITWTPSGSPVATVAEGAPDDTFLALVIVSDADSGPNGEVHAHIQQGSSHFRLKRIHGDNYKIVTNGTLDREKQMMYNLTIVARDRGARPLSCVTQLIVQVLDENDNPPIFSKALYSTSVKENNAPGLQILTVKAHDVDLELSGEVSYSIQETNELGTPTASFSIHPTSGALFVQQSLDFEYLKSFSFVVEARDHGRPPLTSSATVLVNVVDVNDNAPLIEDPSVKKGRAIVIVPVNAEKGDIVAELGNGQEQQLLHHLKGNQSSLKRLGCHLATTIRASDLDSGLNGKLQFKITKDNSGLFWLNGTTGQLFVNTSNATELIGKTFEVEMAVTDMGSPSLSTKTTLDITFINLLDHLKNSSPGQRGQLTFTMMLAVCLGVTCLFLLLAVALVTTFCRPEKRDNRAYNCRQAESSYTRHPRRPQKHIQKADIQLVPVLRGRREEQIQCEIQPLHTAVPGLEEDSPDHLDQSRGFIEDQPSMSMNHTRTLCKPSSIELDGTLPCTPASPYRSLRRPRISTSSYSPSQASTLRRNAHLEVQTTPADNLSGGLPSTSPSRTLRRQKNLESKRMPDDNHRQLLQKLVRLSMAAFGENGGIEFSSASPEVQQVSQLLTLLHQGQFQPRPNFRGNKYSHRNGRSGTQDADWLSTKDSGHGESEAGDVDWDTGRDSPIDPQLGEGLDALLGHTDDVFTDAPDPDWMARLSLPPSADYHENVFVPEGPPAPDCSQDGTCFSTFGKSSEKDGPLGGALLSEVSTLFEMLLSQKAESQPRSSAQLLYRLSAAYRRSLGLDGTPAGGDRGGTEGPAHSPTSCTQSQL